MRTRTFGSEELAPTVSTFVDVVLGTPARVARDHFGARFPMSMWHVRRVAVV
jgi:hypothetical protein